MRRYKKLKNSWSITRIKTHNDATKPMGRKFAPDIAIDRSNDKITEWERGYEAGQTDMKNNLK